MIKGLSYQSHCRSPMQLATCYTTTPLTLPTHLLLRHTSCITYDHYLPWACCGVCATLRAPSAITSACKAWCDSPLSHYYVLHTYYSTVKHTYFSPPAPPPNGRALLGRRTSSACVVRVTTSSHFLLRHRPWPKNWERERELLKETGRQL